MCNQRTILVKPDDKSQGMHEAIKSPISTPISSHRNNTNTPNFCTCFISRPPQLRENNGSWIFKQ